VADANTRLPAVDTLADLEQEGVNIPFTTPSRLVDDSVGHGTILVQGERKKPSGPLTQGVRFKKPRRKRGVRRWRGGYCGLSSTVLLLSLLLCTILTLAAAIG
jgi:hypothetical protein